MTSKILNLVKQLEVGEKKELYDHIKRQYIREEKTDMLRDDIRDKVLELVLENFQWVIELKETDKLIDPEVLDSLDVVEFALYVEKEFEIDFISPDDIFKWKAVSDIVNYIEDHISDSDE